MPEQQSAPWHVVKGHILYINLQTLLRGKSSSEACMVEGYNLQLHMLPASQISHCKACLRDTPEAPCNSMAHISQHSAKLLLYCA